MTPSPFRGVLQLRAELAQSSEAIDHRFRQGAKQDSLDLRRDVGVVAQFARVVGHDLEHRRGERVRTKRIAAAQELVRNDAEGKDVGLLRHALTANLLGNHIFHGSEYRARFRELALADFGYDEIENFDDTASNNEDVGRLDVTMDDPMCVSFGQTGRHLIDDGDLLRERERLLLPKKGRQGRALEKLHHEKGGVAFLEQLVHRDDVRVLKLPCGLCLLQESFPKLSLVGRIRDRHRLDCHGATEPRVDGAIDHAHGATADETAHLVPTDLVGNDNFGHQFLGGSSMVAPKTPNC